MENLTKKQAINILFNNDFRDNKQIEQNEEIIDAIDDVITTIFYSDIDISQDDNKRALHYLFVIRECLKCRES